MHGGGEDVFANALDDVGVGLAAAIFPDLRPGGFVVGLGVHGIFVLIGVKGIGDFAGQLFGHGIVAARIIGLDGRGADNHFGAEALEQIDLLLGLLIGNSENHFVTAHRCDEREAHAGIAGSAFDDRAAGLEQAFALGFVDHGDADAVLDRAAGIQVIGFDVHLGLAVAGQAIEANEWCMADGFEDVFALHVVIENAVYHAAASNHAHARERRRESKMLAGTHP